MKKQEKRRRYQDDFLSKKEQQIARNLRHYQRKGYEFVEDLLGDLILIKKFKKKKNHIIRTFLDSKNQIFTYDFHGWRLIGTAV